MSAHRIAVVLGSSFFAFPAHLGFLRGIVEAGWKPTAVSGSSAGAIVAGLYAAGVEFEAMERAFTQPGLRKKFREPHALLRLIKMLLGLRGCTGLFTGHKMAAMLHELLKEHRIEACQKATLCLAVSDLVKGRVELRWSGPLLETIMASCAVPGMMMPVLLDSEPRWDGGLSSSLPVEPWVEDHEITHIIAHGILNAPRESADASKKAHSLASAMMAAHQLTADEILRWKLELARAKGKIVIPVETVTPRPRLGLPLTLPSWTPWPEQAQQMIKAGAASAVSVVAQLSRA